MIERWTDRKCNDDKRCQFDINTESPYDAAGVVAEVCKACCPQCCTEDVIGYELAIIHLANPGDNRGESAGNWDKHREDNRAGAIFFIKILGSLQVFLMKKPAIFTLEK